jgi:hypothetical protein
MLGAESLDSKIRRRPHGEPPRTDLASGVGWITPEATVTCKRTGSDAGPVCAGVSAADRWFYTAGSTGRGHC